ncbi:hypothetical protein SRHO_G00204370 [Serrasalmus rhombeus]
MEGKMAVTQQGGSPEAENVQNAFHSTQDMDRELPLVTTAPPFAGLNHHPPFKAFPRPDSHHQGPQEFEDRLRVEPHLFKGPSTELVPHEDAAPFFDVAATSPTTASLSMPPATSTAVQQQVGSRQLSGTPGEKIQRRSFEEPSAALTTESLTTTVMPTSAPPPCHTAREKQPGHVDMATAQEPQAVTTLVTREEEEAPKTRAQHDTDATAVSRDPDDETTTTTIITTTVITTMQTPVPCSTNFTATGGYIETPPAQRLGTTRMLTAPTL